MKETYQKIFVVIFCIFFVLVPLLPDIQISRPKLLGIEIISFLLLTIYVIFIVVENKILYFENKIGVFVFIFLSYILIRYFFFSDRPFAYTELKRWTLSIWLLYLITILGNKNYNVLITTYIFGSFLAVIYGFLQHTGGFYRIQVPKFDRVISMFGNPIFFAVHIINFLPIVFGRILIEKRFFVKLIYLTVFIVSLITLYYTKTRAAFVGLFVSFLVLIFLLLPQKQKVKYLFSLLFLFIVFVLITKNIWLRQQAHFLIWRDSIKMWSSKPFFGIGLGKFHVEFVNFASEELRKIWPEKQCIINDAHNEYVQLLAENGIIGFTLFLLFLYYFFEFVIKFVKNLDSTKLKNKYELKITICSLLVGVIAVLVQNFFSVDMRFVISNIYLFITIGFILGYTSDINQKNLVFKSYFIKLISLLICFFILGIISYSSKQKVVSFISLIHFTQNGVKIQPDDVGEGLLQQVLRPYLANYKLKQEKDFFDEKILDATNTIKELEELKQKYPDKSLIYEKLAWVYAKEKNFQKAIENYLIAVKINPNSYSAYNNLGNIMFLTGNKQQAVEFYKKSIEIKPEQIDSRLNLGILYYYEGKLNLAAEQFNKVLELDPNNEKAIVYLKRMRE
jgi:tetratricopeptide (TPR) repeat protein